MITPLLALGIGESILLIGILGGCVGGFASIAGTLGKIERHLARIANSLESSDATNDKLT